MVVEDADFTLKHRNTNTIIPSALLLPHRKHKTAPPIIANGHHRASDVEFFTSTADFELLSLKQSSSPLVDSYTSLKDILPSSPSSILSPTPAATLAGVSSSSSGSGYEISIRNRLVKQAAWAYLQPSVLTSSSSSRGFCISGEHFRLMIDELLRDVSETMSRFYDWLVDALWLILCR